MGNRKKLTVTLSLDVEEEGLFSGIYSRVNPSLQNIAYLEELKPFLERGIKPTLFCAWPVFQDSKARKILDNLRRQYSLEIGAHLHFWNTPPLVEGPDTTAVPAYHNVPSIRVNPAIMKAKLLRLLDAANDFNSAPVTSFRMGRWDIHRIHWPLLVACGIKCDASVRPFHSGRHADIPDHFSAPSDPYLLRNQFGSIFEVPLTVTSWLPFHKQLKRKNLFVSLIKDGFQHWGALPLLSIEYPLPILKLVTLLHIGGGGRNLSLTWHSSEMMVKGAPHMSNTRKVHKFLTKMQAYFTWLEKRFDISYESMESLRLKKEASAPEVEDPEGDWSFPKEEIFAIAESDLKFP